MLLSLCIPTFNRAGTLTTLLNSIVKQCDDFNKNDVEIVICDNHSTDHTREIVEGMKAESGFSIKYIVHNENTGLIKNVFSTVKHASGEFCWFLGSDDIMEPGAIKRVIAVLEKHPYVKILLPRFNVYNFNLDQIETDLPRPIYHFNNEEIITEFDSVSEYIVYELGYLSILIFNREAWNDVKELPEFEYNNYYHVHKLIKIAQNYPIMVLHDKLTGYRKDNDGIRAELGVFARIRILVEEYIVLLKDALEGTSYAKNLRQHLVFHIAGSLRDVQLYLSLSNRIKLFRLLYSYYKTDYFFWKKIAWRIFIPAFIIRLIVAIKS